MCPCPCVCQCIRAQKLQVQHIWCCIQHPYQVLQAAPASSAALALQQHGHLQESRSSISQTCRQSTQVPAAMLALTGSKSKMHICTDFWPPECSLSCCYMCRLLQLLAAGLSAAPPKKVLCMQNITQPWSACCTCTAQMSLFNFLPVLNLL